MDTEHRTLTADGFFANCEDLDDAIAANFPWPDPALYIDPDECRRLVDEAPKDKAVLGMVWACHFQDFCAAFGHADGVDEYGSAVRSWSTMSTIRSWNSISRR